MQTSIVRILSVLGIVGIALGVPACGGKASMDGGTDGGSDGSVRDGDTEDGAVDDDMGGLNDGSVDDGVPPMDMGPPCEPDCSGLDCGLDPECGEIGRAHV